MVKLPIYRRPILTLISPGDLPGDSVVSTSQRLVRTVGEVTQQSAATGAAWPNDGLSWNRDLSIWNVETIGNGYRTNDDLIGVFYLQRFLGWPCQVVSMSFTGCNHVVFLLQMMRHLARSAPQQDGLHEQRWRLCTELGKPMHVKSC